MPSGLLGEFSALHRIGAEDLVLFLCRVSLHECLRNNSQSTPGDGLQIDSEIGFAVTFRGRVSRSGCDGQRIYRSREVLVGYFRSMADSLQPYCRTRCHFIFHERQR